jgi:hypothetical protein
MYSWKKPGITPDVLCSSSAIDVVLSRVGNRCYHASLPDCPKLMCLLARSRRMGRLHPGAIAVAAIHTMEL